MRKSTLTALVAGACAILAVGGFALRAHGQAADYAQAVQLADQGNAQAAYQLFDGLGSYRDAPARRDALAAANPALPYQDAAKGSVVEFGSWEQDGYADNGAEPIRWIVLDRVDGRLLLLAEQCLDARPYNPVEFQAVTWENCELRAWLNGEFLSEAFSAGQRGIVCEVENVNDDRLAADDEDDPMHDIFAQDAAKADQMGSGGNNTADRVFLLSETDTLIYLYDEAARELTGKAALAPAAAARGAQVFPDGSVGWWLRSPGVYGFTAQFVDETGAPYTSGAYVELVYGVRPALWLDLRGAGDGEGVR